MEPDLTLTVVSIAIALVLLALWKIPELQVRSAQRKYGPAQPTDLMKAENDRRVTLAQIVGGAAVLAGLYFTAQNFNLQQQGQITDRINKAVEQLGNDKQPDIALGGIYQLGRIARDSASDHWPMLQVLMSYVERHAALSEVQVKRECNPIQPYNTGEMVDANVQAVADVLRTRSLRDESGQQHITIVHSNLRRVDFTDANLSGAVLVGNDMQGAIVKGAVLGKGARLNYSLLDHTNFSSSNLAGSSFEHVCLMWSQLTSADFTDADLQDSDLRHLGDVSDTNLSGAKLDRADLRNTDLRKAKGLTTQQLEQAIMDCTTLLPTDLSEVQEKLKCE